MIGKADKPLESAVLCRESGKKITARLSNDGCTFNIGPSDFIVDKSGSYWLELTDREGIRGGGDDCWEIHAVANAPPTVQIEQPTANLFVTANAVVPICVSAKDDIAVCNIFLAFRCGERDSPIFADTKIGTVPTEGTLPLFAGPAGAASARVGTGFCRLAIPGRSSHRPQPVGTRTARIAAGDASHVPCRRRRLFAPGGQERAAD